MNEKRLTWSHSGWYKGEKPPEYDAYNQDEEHVGTLAYSRVGAHMHWCWQDQPAHIKMSPGCLEEVRDKQKELFKEVHK